MTLAKTKRKGHFKTDRLNDFLCVRLKSSTIANFDPKEALRRFQVGHFYHCNCLPNPSKMCTSHTVKHEYTLPNHIPLIQVTERGNTRLFAKAKPKTMDEHVSLGSAPALMSGSGIMDSAVRDEPVGTTAEGTDESEAVDIEGIVDVPSTGSVEIVNSLSTEDGGDQSEDEGFEDFFPDEEEPAVFTKLRHIVRAFSDS